tara:strand:- start:9737 stop:9904 length:168 start_codon:yes stop_codon:yes gene_type:complete
MSKDIKGFCFKSGYFRRFKLVYMHDNKYKLEVEEIDKTQEKIKMPIGLNTKETCN